MTSARKRLIAVFMCTCAGPGSLGLDVIAQTAELLPPEYGLWEGEWLMAGSSPEDNVYSILRIHEADSAGFSYEMECREIPYGPNAFWSGQNRAAFQGPLAASHAPTATRFTLSVNPDDRHDRLLEMAPLPCTHTDAPSNTFLFRRTVLRAGFDCERAATPVERAICGNELLAQGDFEIGVLYRELLGDLPDSAGEALRLEQRVWLGRRDSGCGSGDAVDEACLAHLYADRLVALEQLADPNLGAAPRFDAAYALTRIARGADLRLDTAFRLAMYPQEMDPAGSATWRADPEGLLFEQAYVSTRTVWPSDVDFRYSDMLYVDRDGTVWTVQHTGTAQPLHPDSGIRPDRLWLEAGRDPLTIRTEAEPSAPRPAAVVRWLNEHGVGEPPESR